MRFAGGNHFLQEDFPVCCADEKWFYMITRQKRLKYLPLRVDEPKGADIVKIPKTRSPQFPIKIMYLGAVARTRSFTDRYFEGRHFNGRIFLNHVSKTRKVESKRNHTHFLRDALSNYDIKGGRWKNFYIDGMKVTKIIDWIVYAYDKNCSHLSIFLVKIHRKKTGSQS